MGQPNNPIADVAGDRSPEIRVFISSTFRDLQAEREHLIKKVFPELRLLCRERGVELTEIDLRWGVTEDEARQGRVIRVCLNEIDRCRPYFLGILGERYGWTPQLEDLAGDPELLRTYPWIESAVTEGRSVTEMEIMHGVLQNPGMADHPFFYFRDPAATPDAPEFREESDDRGARLAGLKEVVRQRGFPVRDFHDSEALGHAVLTDLRGVIDRCYPADRAPSPLERERWAHEAFAATRRRAYIENLGDVGRLDRYAAGEGPPLVVVGDSGIGKSALLAHWSARYRRERPGAFIVTYYLGATSTGGDHLGLILRVMAEIRERYGVDDEMPDSPEQIENDFPLWLARVRGETLVLVIDALDQLEGTPTHLAWLPTYIPPPVRLVVSARDGPARDALRRRQWPELTVQALDLPVRESLIIGYLSQYRKALSEPQRRRIAAQPACGNPLFLRTLLEELRVFGHFDALDLRIDAYLTAPDLDVLLRLVLERMEADYGAGLVREVLSLIWAARRGLSESELLDITGFSRVELSRLLLALDYHLMRRESLLDFFHDHLGRAVQARYAATPSHQTDFHRRLADYFAVQPMSTRRVDELPWQLQRTGEWERLKECLVDPDMFLALDGHERHYEVLGYWLALGDRYDPPEEYILKFNRSLTADDGDEGTNLLTYLNQVCKYLLKAGLHSRPMTGGALALNHLYRIWGIEEGHPEIAVSQSHLGEWDRAMANYAEAESNHRKALKTFAKSLGPDHPVTATLMNNLGLALRARGELDKAEHLFRRALAIAEMTRGPGHPETCNRLNNLGKLLADRGDAAGAESLLRRAVAIAEEARGPEHPETAFCLDNLAHVLSSRGDPVAAEPLHRRALAIRERVLGPRHPDTVYSLNNLAILLHLRGDCAAAEPLQRRAVDIAEVALGPEHPVTATCLDNLAVLRQSMGDLVEAETLFRRALSIREKVHGPEHRDTLASLTGLADVLGARGEQNAALSHHRRALRIRERTLGDHLNTAESLEALSSLHAAAGDHESAVVLLRRALGIRETIQGSEHREVYDVLLRLESALLGVGDYTAVETVFRRIFELSKMMLGPDHPDTLAHLYRLAFVLRKLARTSDAIALLHRELELLEKGRCPETPEVADALKRVGLVFLEGRDLNGAASVLRRALVINERLRGPDHADTLALAELLIQAGDYATAEPVLRRALAIREQAVGPDHPDLAAILLSLGLLLKSSSRPAEAEPVLRRALAISERSLGSWHRTTIDCRFHLPTLPWSTQREPWPTQGDVRLILFLLFLALLWFESCVM